MKVIINTCFGGFSFSDDFVAEYERRTGRACDGCRDDALRTCPSAVALVEEMGVRANGRFAKLRVVEIPFESNEGWHIKDYDGNEHVAENHRTWS